MEYMRPLGLIDTNGSPLAPHIERVLAGLLPRVKRQFPALHDDLALTEVMEEAGRRIATRETRNGPIERIHGYAWVTVRSVATSHMRRSSMRLLQKTLESEASRDYLASVRAEYGSAEQIERDILLREVLATLSSEERLVCLWKKAGFSTQEIAKFQGRSVVAVDTLFSRAKDKVRRALAVEDSVSRNERSGRAAEQAAKTHPFPTQPTNTRDGRIRCAAERSGSIR
jgi:RNA polymerase sigma factor (sigma-70 family)